MSNNILDYFALLADDIPPTFFSSSNDAQNVRGTGLSSGINPFDWLAPFGLFNPPIIGTSGNDVLVAVADGDLVVGLGGNDQLSSAFNRTALLGGTGNDTLTTNVTVPVTSDPPDGLAVQFGGDGRDTLSATGILQGAIPPVGSPGDQTATMTIFQDGGSGDDVVHASLSVAQATTANVALKSLIFGGDGNDRIDVVADAHGALADNLVENVVHGGAGSDRITALARTEFVGFNGTATNVLTGGDGNDTIEGTAIAQSITNLLASNTLTGGGGNDVLHAINQVSSNVGTPVSVMNLSGGDGNDVLDAVGHTTLGQILANDSSHLDGGAGNDVLNVSSFTAALSAEVHNLLEGGSGADALTAHLVATVIGGLVPNPQPQLFDLSNILDGGIGSDSLNANLSIDNASGLADASEAVNRLTGGSGNDRLTATLQLTGTAPLHGDVPALANYLDGGAGDDILAATIAAGTDGTSFLNGGDGNDRLTVFGGSGNVLDGGGGKDTLVSGVGSDTMDGGAGADLLVFAPHNGEDSASFTSGEDKIDLTAFAVCDIHSINNLDISVADGNSIIQFDANNCITVLDDVHLLSSDFLFG